MQFCDAIALGSNQVEVEVEEFLFLIGRFLKNPPLCLVWNRLAKWTEIW